MPLAAAKAVKMCQGTAGTSAVVSLGAPPQVLTGMGLMVLVALVDHQ